MSTQADKLREYNKLREKEKAAANARAKKAAFDKITNELIKLNNNVSKLNAQIKEFNDKAKKEYKTKQGYQIDYLNYFNAAKAAGTLDTPGVIQGLALRRGYILQSQAKIDAFKKQAKDAEIFAKKREKELEKQREKEAKEAKALAQKEAKELEKQRAREAKAQAKTKKNIKRR
jgi:hypothetical protein